MSTYQHHDRPGSLQRLRGVRRRGPGALPPRRQRRRLGGRGRDVGPRSARSGRRLPDGRDLRHGGARRHDEAADDSDRGSRPGRLPHRRDAAGARLRRTHRRRRRTSRIRRTSDRHSRRSCSPERVTTSRCGPTASGTSTRSNCCLGRHVESIDPSATPRSVDGERIDWDALVLATGVQPRRLAGPPGVHHLRTLDDALALRNALDEAIVCRRCRRRLHRRRGRVDALRQGRVGDASSSRVAAPLERVLGPDVGGILAARHRAHGIDLASRRRRRRLQRRRTTRAAFA